MKDNIANLGIHPWTQLETLIPRGQGLRHPNWRGEICSENIFEWPWLGF